MSLWLSGKGGPWTGEFAVVSVDPGAEAAVFDDFAVDSSGALYRLSADKGTVSAVRMQLPPNAVAKLAIRADAGAYFVILRDANGLESLIQLAPR